MSNSATDAKHPAGQSTTPEPPTAVRKRLPGKARPRQEVLQEYQDVNAKRRERIPPVLWQFWAPDPDEFYRWRVQLDCGCITEVLTGGADDLPSQRQWPDSGHRASLPEGQLLCRHEDSPPAPYRDIVEWGDRRHVSFPADPVEPPDWADEQIWDVLRHDEPHTSVFWTVTMSCGHVTEVPVSDLSWKPSDGPRRPSADRVHEMTAEFEEFWATEPEGQDEREREHTKRMLADGWPRPAPEQLCYTCPWTRYIVAYHRIGWLVPRKPTPKTPQTPSRASLEQRLQKTEAEADRLRRQLAQLDAPKQPETNPPSR